MTTITFAASTASISARALCLGVDGGSVDRVSIAVFPNGGAT